MFVFYKNITRKEKDNSKSNLQTVHLMFSQDDRYFSNKNTTNIFCLGRIQQLYLLQQGKV